VEGYFYTCRQMSCSTSSETCMCWFKIEYRCMSVMYYLWVSMHLTMPCFRLSALTWNGLFLYRLWVDDVSVICIWNFSDFSGYKVDAVARLFSYPVKSKWRPGVDKGASGHDASCRKMADRRCWQQFIDLNMWYSQFLIYFYERMVNQSNLSWWTKPMTM